VQKGARNIYCTLFDSAYLSRGLIMYESLRDYTVDFHLFIFAFDDLSLEILKKLNLLNTTIISQKEFETQDLLDVKHHRTKAEYCWTCSSSVIAYVFDNFKVISCTYLDADLFFYDSAEIILNEIPADKSVLITEHRFSKTAQFFEMKKAGRFCVQFITFFNTNDSIAVLNKWKSQSIEWCYARYEDGKFGDQKYLDTWPNDYHNVHILQHLGGGVAPWNAKSADFNFDGDKILGSDHRTRQQFDVIFFHFHFVRIMFNGYADLGWNWLPASIIEGFYRPYVNKIMEKEEFLEKTFSQYKRVLTHPNQKSFREILKTLFKKTFGYNLIKLP